MTRSDYLISMIAAFAKNDRDAFTEDCLALIHFEEEKKNFKLAARMKKAIESPSFLGNATPQSLFNISPLSSKKFKEETTQRRMFNNEDDDFFTIKMPSVTLSDVVLDSSQLSLLKNIVAQWKRSDELIKFNIRPQNKILLFGPPGTGKTLSATALASELNLPLLYVHFDSLISSYLGRTGNNLKKIFDYANANDCVILIDELDAIGKKRDDNQELGELKRIVISLLQNLDTFNNNSLLIACTNHHHLLDPALWRRFDAVISYDFPESFERKALFNKELKNKNVEVEDHWINLLVELTQGISPSTIVNIVNNALRNWVIENKKKLPLYLVEEILRKNLLSSLSDKKKTSLAIMLRTQNRSYSLSYLSELLNVPKSTLHFWIKKEQEEEK